MGFTMKSISLINVSFAYGGADALFDNLSAVFHANQTVAIVGDNGTGKSTLLKIIAGRILPTSGMVKTFGRIAYLDQDLSLLSPDKTVVENIMHVSECKLHDAHAIAANFGFRGDASRRRVGTLSGGELLKATLAAVLGGENHPDLLILDEPTNNLDMNSTDILADALRQYRGAILMVSHDADFVRAAAPDWHTIRI